MTLLWGLCALALAGAVVLLVGPGGARSGLPPDHEHAGSAGGVGGVGGAGGAGVAGRGWLRANRRTRRAPPGHVGSYVLLVAAALRSGAPTSSALELAAAALPGEAADRVGPHAARLRVGADPDQVWSELARDEVLGPLGRVLSRAHRTGAPVAEQVMRLAEELAERDRADQVDAARRVGVKAALPLGLCLLPSFLLLGIVPMAAGLLNTVLT